MKKILVIYATAGAGHRKAAEAVYEELRGVPEKSACCVDSLDHTSRLYKFMYSQSYTFMISKAPWLWELLFKLSDIPWLLRLIQLLRRGYNALNGARLSRYLRQEQFDYIVSTHFFPTEVAGALKKNGRIRSCLITAITDYDVHSFWLSRGVDIYAVACDATRDKLLQMGVPAQKIAVTGVPVSGKFSASRDVTQLKAALGLKPDVFTVLVATGSFGIGPIDQIIEHLPGFQVMVVCGHNAALYERLSRQKKELVKVFGLVNNMHELMAVSDVMITKPGGLSISEALVSGLPMIFFHAIPGQEANNIRVLKKHGIGISGCQVHEMAQILIRYQECEPEFRSAQEATKALAKPQAAKDIIALMK